MKLSFINVFPFDFYPVDDHDLRFVINRIEYPVVAEAYPVTFFFSKFSATPGPGIGCQRKNLPV